MAQRSSGSRKKVTADTLATLGVQRLAEILADVADTRVDLKRRLRMELAAQEGPAPLAAEIDKRLAAFETSRGRIGWRQRPAFIRDLDALRDLIVARLAPLDLAAAIERLWRFMGTSTQSARRYRERNSELESLYARAAGDETAEVAGSPPWLAADTLVETLALDVAGWKAWLPAFLAQAPRPLAVEALRIVTERGGGGPGWVTLIRHLADAAGDIGAFRATCGDDALKSAPVAVELAQRYLAAGQVEEAGQALRAAAPTAAGRGKPVVDFAWETLWIDYLERSGREEEAQAVRWESFERTLSAERARAFIARLADFDDVEAETRAFDIASAARDFRQGLAFLIDWPALPEAARMIERRSDEVQVDPGIAEFWAAKLRRRFPKAAGILLRAGASAALRRRDFKTSARLSEEAETIDV